MYTTERRILLAMAAGEELCDGGKGGGWWLGYSRVRTKTALELLRQCLISANDSGGGAVTYYHINDWGRARLADPTFVPPLHDDKGVSDGA